jgi:hypothetical protein
MKVPRGFVGSAMFNGGLWATGGYGRINSSEVLIDGVWIDGPDLPERLGMDRHCLVTINETTAYLIGEFLLPEPIKI